MTLSIAKAIIAKFTVVNFQGRVSVATGQNTVLVIKKSAILDLQIPFFQSDSSAIIIGNRCPNEVESLDC